MQPPSKRQKRSSDRQRRRWRRDATKSFTSGAYPLFSLPVDVCINIASFLRCNEIRSLRLASLGIKDTPIRDPLLTQKLILSIRPFQTRAETEAFVSQQDEYIKWFCRNSIHFITDAFFYDCREFIEATNCMSEVQSVYFKMPRNYHFMYRLGEKVAMKRMIIDGCPGMFRRQGGEYPSYVKNLVSGENYVNFDMIGNTSIMQLLTIYT